MTELALDQATGLRRLLGAAAVRSIAIMSGACVSGRATVCANTAFALSRRGSRVCVLGESGAGGAAGRFGLRSGGDLAAVVERRLRLADAVVDGPEGVRFLAASYPESLLAGLAPADEARLARAFADLDSPPDVLLADAPATGGGPVPVPALAASEIVVVVSGAADAITEAYALMKRLTWDFARRRCHLVVNRVREQDRAEAIFGNLQDTASRFLGLELRWLGWIPEDEALRRAERLHQPVIGAFPESPAARAFRDVAETVAAWPLGVDDGFGGFVQRLVQASRIGALADGS